ncbi:MAG: glycosyltransferase [Candidatus Aminicenantes bacterium]|nr:glycosyltransferase [Candidatus Aminicenantes bacterium]
MKLLIIITDLNVGGAERMLLKVLERLDTRFSPNVISLGTLGDIGPRIQALGIPVEALGMRPGMLIPIVFSRLVRRLKTIKPDVVHTWMYHADLVGGLAARIAGVKAIGWSIRHGNLSPKVNKRTTLAVIRACAGLSRWVPDRILSCSEEARKAHINFGNAADKIVVVPNGFDLARYKPDLAAYASVRSELGLGEDASLVGMIGRFDQQKNHTGFFEAAGLLHKKMPSTHFLLAGQGIDDKNSELMRAVHASGAGGVTHLLGLRRDIPRLMAALDVLASPAHGEAFPNVLGEAMACGVPCVVTDVGDSAYIVGDTGRALPPGDMAGLAAALEDLLALPAAELAELGERARARVVEHFEIGNVVKRYEAFYDGLAEIGRNRSL